MLRLKGLQAEEEAYIGRMVRRGADPRVQDLARDIAGFRRQLARLSSGGGQPAQVAALTARLEANELALGRLSRDYQQHLQVRAFNLDDLLATLPPRTALLEIREYEPFDFSAYQFGAPRWAGLLLSGNGTRAVDLGPVKGMQVRVAALLADLTGPAGIDAAAALQVQLLGPLAADLAGLERLYVAPDGVLNLVPFAALRGPDGKRLAELLDLRLLLTGRDLLRPEADRPAQGLLALGGIDFGEAAPVQPASAGQSADPLFGGIGAGELRQRTAAALPRSFRPLPATAAEVTAVAQQYRFFRRDEPAPELWEGSGASEARLKALQRPPRVLHLATHGFYRAADHPQDGPMLLSGLALAGANQALAGTKEDGILYAIEAQDLNLEGTELVVLSACETAQGQIDYGEGLSGLVRALRTAGARYVLVTLTKVNDQAAAAYMRRFYHYWLSQPGRSDPAAALRAAQREAIADNERLATANQIWAQFVLIGG